MKTHHRARLWFACGLLMSATSLSCTKNSVSSTAGTPVSLAVKFPELPPNLVGDTWLAPFQLNILIEGANGFVHRQAITGNTEIVLNSVPLGSLRIRANYFGFEIPNTMTADAMCHDDSSSTALNLGGEGDGPSAMYLAASDQTVNVGGASEFTVAFPSTSLQLATELKFAANLKYGDGTPAANAVLNYRDILTGLPITGPCGAGNGPQEEVDANGRLVGKYFIGSQAMDLPVFVTHNGANIPLTFKLSPTNEVLNFFNVNLSTKVVTVAAGTEDFDGDGQSNQAEIAANEDPFCGPSYCSGDYGDGGNNSGPFALTNQYPYPNNTDAKFDPAGNISLYFNRYINAGSVLNKISLNIDSDNTSVSITCDTKWDNVLCKPNSLLNSNTTYRISVSPGITATDNSVLSDPMEWTFATGDVNTQPLLVEFVWPNKKDRPQIGKYVHFGVKFNRSLDFTSIPTLTLTDTTTNSNLNTRCYYREEGGYHDGGSRGSLECDPVVSATNTSTLPLTPGRRYELKIPGGSTGVVDNMGNNLYQDVKHQFTVYNNPSDTAAPLIDRFVPAKNQTNVRQDAVFGVFFNKPVEMDTWSIRYSGKFTIKNKTTSEQIPLERCEYFSDFNGFLCRAESILDPGTYTATLAASFARAANDTHNPGDTWDFTVVNSDNSVLARVFEHPISGAATDLTRLGVLTVFNKPIRTSGDPNISPLTISSTPYPVGTPMPTDSYRGTTFDGFAYTESVSRLFQAGTFNIALNNIIVDEYTAPTGTPTPTPTPTPQVWSAALTAPALNITKFYPMPGETASKYSPIILGFNKPLNVLSVLDLRNAIEIKVNGTVLTTFAVATAGYAYPTYTGTIKITPNSPFPQGATIGVTLKNTTLNSPFAGFSAARSFSFTTQATEQTAWVSDYWPKGGFLKNLSTTTTVKIAFNRPLKDAQSTAKIKVCDVDTDPTCTTPTEYTPYLEYGSALASEPSYSVSASSFLPEKKYRITVSGFVNADGSAIPTFAWEFKNLLASPYVHTNFISDTGTGAWHWSETEPVLIAKAWDPAQSAGSLSVSAVTTSCDASLDTSQFQSQYYGSDHYINALALPLLPSPCWATFTLTNTYGKSVSFVGDLSKIWRVPVARTSSATTGVTPATNQSGLSTVSAPSQDCGQTGTLASRIADCIVQNPSTASHSDGSNPQKYNWSLVAKQAGVAVWKDNLSGLIWSDRIGGTSFIANWCHAGGTNTKPNSALYESDSTCSDPSKQSQTAPVSLCAEDPLNLNGTLNSDIAKGGLGKLSGATTPVVWKLPSIDEFKTAFEHGAGVVLPNMAANYWTSTVDSSNYFNAYALLGDNGSVTLDARSNLKPVRCVAIDPS